MDDIILNADDLSTPVTVPAWTTVEYFDKDGNLIAHFDAPRQYEKKCDVSKLDLDHCPITVKFTAQTPDSQHTDSDY